MMDEFTLKVLGSLIGIGASGWVLYQFQRAVFGQYAKKDAVEELKTDFHNLRNRAVTTDALRERKEEVDRQLEARRQDVITLHAKIDDHAKTDNELHNKMLESLHAIGSAVARIEGRLER